MMEDCVQEQIPLSTNNHKLLHWQINADTKLKVNYPNAQCLSIKLYYYFWVCFLTNINELATSWETLANQRLLHLLMTCELSLCTCKNLTSAYNKKQVCNQVLVKSWSNWNSWMLHMGTIVKALLNIYTENSDYWIFRHPFLPKINQDN